MGGGFIWKLFVVVVVVCVRLGDWERTHGQLHQLNEDSSWSSLEGGGELYWSSLERGGVEFLLLLLIRCCAVRRWWSPPAKPAVTIFFTHLDLFWMLLFDSNFFLRYLISDFANLYLISLGSWECLLLLTEEGAKCLWARVRVDFPAGGTSPAWALLASGGGASVRKSPESWAGDVTSKLFAIQGHIIGKDLPELEKRMNLCSLLISCLGSTSYIVCQGP